MAVVAARLTNQGCHAWLLSDCYVARPSSTKDLSALSWTKSLTVSAVFTLNQKIKGHCITSIKKGQNLLTLFAFN